MECTYVTVPGAGGRAILSLGLSLTRTAFFGRGCSAFTSRPAHARGFSFGSWYRSLSGSGLRAGQAFGAAVVVGIYIFFVWLVGKSG